jgi:hypothetical protein
VVRTDRVFVDRDKEASMRAIYVLSPDAPASPKERTAPGDSNVSWVVTRPPFDDFARLIRTLRLVAGVEEPDSNTRPALINVLRICAHGNGGEISLFGQGNSRTLNFSKPDVLEQIKKLRPIFDRSAGARREIYLHSCYAASDTPVTCADQGASSRCPTRGVMDKSKRNSVASAGLTLMHGLADVLDVPVIGTPDLIYFKGKYDWTMPGRMLYVYPSSSGSNVVDFAGVDLSGSLFGKIPSGLIPPETVAIETNGTLQPLGLVGVAGTITSHNFGPGTYYGGTMTLASNAGTVKIEVSGSGRSPAWVKPVTLDYSVVRGTGEFLGSHGSGKVVYTLSPTVTDLNPEPSFLLSFSRV